MASEGPEAAEQAPSLVNVLLQLELPAVESLVEILAHYRCIPHFRLTCRELRDLADTTVCLPKPLSLQLRGDGTVTEPLTALGRWGRRGGIRLDLKVPAEAPNAGVDALLRAAFAVLPEAVRRRVWKVHVSRSNYAVPSPVVSCAAVPALLPALAASLPCLRSLSLSILPSGGAGEAYAALAALGTLEKLELPGVLGLTGVEVLAGSLRRLKVRELSHTLTPSAAAPLGQLTKLETLSLRVRDVDLGEGPTVRNLLRLLPESLRALELYYGNWGGDLWHGLDGTFGIYGGRLVSVELGLVFISWLSAVAREELLPCLGPGGRLESLSIHSLYADGWGSLAVAPVLELWRRSDKARLHELAVDQQCRAVDICSALTALRHVDALSFRGPAVDIRLPLQPQPLSPLSAVPVLLDLPPPEEVLRVALQRLAPPGAGGAAGGGLAAGPAAADSDGILVLRGPAAAAALEQPSSEAAVKAWAQDLERRARAGAGDALADGGPLITHALPLPPASAVLLECSEVAGAAEAVAAAVAAAGDGSEAARVRAHCGRDRCETSLGWSLGMVMSELWAASCAGEGGPSLQQRVEWAVAVLGFVDGLPRGVAP